MPTLDNVIDDCEWVVERAKEHLKQRDDKHGARAWIITAKSLFPYRFIVQFEALKLHIACDEYQNAAQSLMELCVHFPKEERLQSLVLEVFATSTGESEAGGVKLHKVYQQLSPPSRKKILLTISDAISDPLVKGKLAVATLRMFPDTTLTLGLDMYDLLTQSFSRATVPAADNKHRELLVTELIPLLATSPCVIVEHPFLRSSGQSMVLKTSHVCQWLEVAASFFTTLTVQELLLKKSHSFTGKTGWEALHHIFLSVCDKCGWIEILHNKQIGPRLPNKVRWIGLQNISGYNPLRVGFEIPRGVAISCFYISVSLFFEAAWTYYSHLHQISKEGDTTCWALVEDISHNTASDKFNPAKKRRLEDGDSSEGTIINLQTGGKIPDAAVLESFTVAMDCWSFLHSSTTYRGEFSRLCQQWGAIEWNWMTAFKIDMALYKGDHELYKKLLQTEREKIKPDDREIGKIDRLRVLLQLINAYLLLGDSKAACNLATELISLLPSPQVANNEPINSGRPPSPGIKAGRLLRLIGCQAKDIVPYTLDIILNAIKSIAFSDSCSDTALGQLMVLSQYNWPKEVELFTSVLSRIQKRGSFTYREFFDYIITVEMLEEVMYLINQGKVNIDIMPCDSNTRGHSVATRGVNNKAKEELMTLVDRQLAKCDGNMDTVIRNFFNNEKLCFISDTKTTTSE